MDLEYKIIYSTERSQRRGLNSLRCRLSDFNEIV